jgi:hypothetical protein
MPYYQHSQLRNLTIAVGTIFNSLFIRKMDDESNIVDEHRVPLSYSSKDRFLTKIKSLNTSVNVQNFIPRIGFMMESMAYASDRQLSPHNKLDGNPRHGATGWAKANTYTPSPYDVEYIVSIYTNTMDEALQIVEQIAPMFRPNFNVTVNEIPELEILRDIPVILNSVNIDDNWSSNFDQGGLRSIVFDISLTARANLHPPVSKVGIIETTFINFIPLSGSGDIEDEEIWMTPTKQEVYLFCGASLVCDAYVNRLPVIGVDFHGNCMISAAPS